MLRKRIYRDFWRSLCILRYQLKSSQTFSFARKGHPLSWWSSCTNESNYVISIYLISGSPFHIIKAYLRKYVACVSLILDNTVYQNEFIIHGKERNKLHTKLVHELRWDGAYATILSIRNFREPRQYNTLHNLEVKLYIIVQWVVSIILI